MELLGERASMLRRALWHLTGATLTTEQRERQPQRPCFDSFQLLSFS